MNKLIAFLLLVVVSLTGFSQSQTPTEKNEYLRKSKSQKTIAWILAGGGVTMSAIAIASYNYGDIVNIVEGDNSSINTKGTFLILGGVVALASIPFFIASGKNKRKSMNLSFKNETAPQIQQNSFVYRAVPSLTLKMSL
jgi:hypothetical protein